MRTNCLSCDEIVAVVNGWVEPHSRIDRHLHTIQACSLADREYSVNPACELVTCLLCGEQDIPVVPNGHYPIHYNSAGIECEHSGKSIQNYLYGPEAQQLSAEFNFAELDFPLIG